MTIASAIKDYVATLSRDLSYKVHVLSVAQHRYKRNKKDRYTLYGADATSVAVHSELKELVDNGHKKISRIEAAFSQLQYKTRTLLKSLGSRFTVFHTVKLP